jgi:hypothetical protein
MAEHSVIGESTEPLTKDDVAEPERAYFPTFQEWISDGNAEQIIKHASSLTASTDIVIYTVPKGYTLFITSAFLHCSNEGTGAAGASSPAGIFIGKADAYLFLARLLADKAQELTFANSYTMPIRITSGMTVYVRNPYATTDTLAGFTGFLLPSKISIR